MPTSRLQKQKETLAMTFTFQRARRLALIAFSFMLLAGNALAADIRVISSGGFTAAYQQLIPLYEQASQNKVITSYGASIGNAPDSIPSRLARGETFDIVILADSGLEALAKEGKVAP